MQQKQCVITERVGGDAASRHEVFEDFRTALDTLAARHGKMYEHSRERVRQVLEGQITCDVLVSFESTKDGVGAIYYVAAATLNLK